MNLPALGDAAFGLTPHNLLTFAHNAPDELQELVDGFAHDLAVISNLPVASDAPAEEQLSPPRNMLAELFGIPGGTYSKPLDTPAKEEPTDDPH